LENKLIFVLNKIKKD